MMVRCSPLCVTLSESFKQALLVSRSRSFTKERSNVGVYEGRRNKKEAFLFVSFFKMRGGLESLPSTIFILLCSHYFH